jgi:D-glycero-alpha-D-manno-heptose-7-phosphate kinase
VVADEIELSSIDRRALQGQIMLFFTGVTRSADPILREQSANIATTLSQLDSLRDLAASTSELLRRGDVGAVGDAIRQGWETKRQLASGVSNEGIDRMVAMALRAGAAGVKVTGAGGGGFLLVVCAPEHQRAVRHSLGTLKELPVGLDRLGSRVVLNIMRDIWA